ncbi:MAG TPA: hypothetical protein VFB00_07000, partial [Terriglobales bacterium]|nr:hypothetical protein [Terriglobales bacterium]
RLNEFINEITALSYRGMPVWFLACPIPGWVSEHGKLGSLCRTYTNLLVARVRNISQVTSVHWPATISGPGFEDHEGDRLGHIPFTQTAFDHLGEFAAAEIARTLAQKDSSASHVATGGSPELAAYLAGLNVQVELAPAGSGGRPHVDRILRTAASFSLTGERPDISDSEVDAILASPGCALVSVRDRFSDHGPSGVVVYRWSDNALVVSSFSLSCTVLGKQVEHAVVSALAHTAAERRSTKIVFEFRRSGRNQPMQSFLQSVADLEGPHYVLPVELAEARISGAAINPGAWSLNRAGVGEEAALR